MSDERLEERLARLERERIAADARYNDALTAVDRAVRSAPDFPHPPPAYDTSKLPEINSTWDILPAGAPALNESFKGRLRAFVWRIIGPPLETQRHFNAAVVDHFNRNVAAHEEAEKAATSVIARLKEEVESLVTFETELIRYFQTLTLYVDTKDRAVGGGAEIVNAGLGAITDDWLKRWNSLGVREERFLRQVQSVDDVRQTAAMAQQSALSLKREVERLLHAGAEVEASRGASNESVVAPDLDAFKYLGFEEAFRGSIDDIRQRLTAYVPLFEGASVVLDIGCGRGEFLELLAARGVAARGLDANHAMVESARARGLDVTEGDALGYLAGLPDDSLGGIFASQVVEHLQPSYLMAVLETAAHKLRPGGVIVLETVNAACWLAFFEAYIRDVTHARALHPETLQYLVRASGFHDVELKFTSPVAETSRLDSVPRPAGTENAAILDLVDAFNDNVAKLNGRMFTFQDYAVIGRK